jgi:O-antigen/teichoic acid export membrane protein
MPSDFPMKDPQKIWQNQPTEPLKMSASDLRRKALDRQSKSRFEALSTILIGIVLCVVFAWSFAKAHTMLARMGWGLLGLYGIYAAYHAYKWIWPGNLPEEAPMSTCLEFYRRALERRRDYQHSWWRSGLPFLLLLGIVMAALGTGARNAPPHPLLNALPFLLVLLIWVVGFLFMRKKLGRENLQREIEELRAFERESR